MSYKNVRVYLGGVISVNGKKYLCDTKTTWTPFTCDKFYKIYDVNNPLGTNLIGEFEIIKYDNQDQFRQLVYDLIMQYERNLTIDKICQ